MFKKALSIFLIFAFILIMTMTIYANAETTAVEPTIKLTKVEGLKNTLGVQKLDIRVNGFSGYKIIVDTDFESVYFEGEEVLEVEDITKFKVKTCVLTNTWKWYTNLVNLAEGENEIILEIKKNDKLFKMKCVVVVDYPDTSSTAGTTTSTTDTTTNTDTSTPTPTSTADITPTVSDTTTPETTTIPANVNNMPDTGEPLPIAYVVIGIIVLSAGALLFKKFVLN